MSSIKKLNVIIICQFGASTSYLEKNIIEAAKKRGIEIDVKSFPVSAGYDRTTDESTLDYSKVDVILLAPQVKYLKGRYEGLSKEYGFVLGEIPLRIYGMCDGEGALNHMLKLIEEKKKG
ncbi:MAG: PTS sugar transporter subunit IIB [Candidatus Asgardarchaeia archaeon]